MKITKLSSKDAILLVFLIVLIIGVVYYLAFLTPLKNELTSIDLQCSELDTEIALAQEKAASMDEMQAELDDIKAKKADEITEIAPYDNQKEILKFLNSVLLSSQNYDLNCQYPEIDESGTVRRDVTLKYTCESYANAKAILKDLSKWNYRCLIKDVTINSEEAEGGIANGPVSVSATMTFFESTAL